MSQSENRVEMAPREGEREVTARPENRVVLWAVPRFHRAAWEASRNNAVAPLAPVAEAAAGGRGVGRLARLR